MDGSSPVRTQQQTLLPPYAGAAGAAVAAAAAPPLGETKAQGAVAAAATVNRRCGVHIVTAVWRAGRSGAITDHSSVCFGVNPCSGELQCGYTAAAWYQQGRVGVGISAACQAPHIRHPDSGRTVAGVRLPGIPDVLAMVQQAHAVMAPQLPLAGWDVALTPGTCA